MKGLFGFLLVAAVTFATLVENGSCAASPPATPPASCLDRPALNDDLFLPVIGRCDQYLWCYKIGNEQQHSLMTCASAGAQGNLYFNYEKQLCDWPENVKC